MNKKTPIIVIIVLTVLMVGYIGIDFFLKWHRTELRAAQAQTQSECDQKITVLEQELQNLEEALINEKNFFLSSERINDAFGRDISELIQEKSTLSPEECQSVNEALASFFSYLDNNGYSDRYHLTDGTFAYFKKTLRLLAKHPPQFMGESADLLNLMQSISHFSRVLGRTGTLVAKDVLVNETDILEPAMALFYQLLLNRDTCPADDTIPALSTLYEYAYFFLNTLSGKSYLMRRNSKLRIIASYYSLMIVRIAERKSMNIYGLDPRNQAELLLYDIENHRGLLYKKTYVEHLERIIETTPGIRPEDMGTSVGHLQGDNRS